MYDTDWRCPCAVMGVSSAAAASTSAAAAAAAGFSAAGS